MGCLAASLASTYSVPEALNTPPHLDCDNPKCLQTLSHGLRWGTWDEAQGVPTSPHLEKNTRLAELGVWSPRVGEPGHDLLCSPGGRNVQVDTGPLRAKERLLALEGEFTLCTKDPPLEGSVMFWHLLTGQEERLHPSLKSSTPWCQNDQHSGMT